MAASRQDGHPIARQSGYDRRAGNRSERGHSRGYDRDASQEDRRHIGGLHDYATDSPQHNSYYGPRPHQHQQPSTSYSHHSPTVLHSRRFYGQEPYMTDNDYQEDDHDRLSERHRLRVRDYAESSSRPDMTMRAAFVPYVSEQAKEAPAPRFDPIAMMDAENEPRQYRLIIRQSPKHGQMCTLGSKNRRTLDPLPIIELDLRDKDGELDVIGQNNPFLLMQVHLIADYIDVKGRSSSTLAPTSSASDSSSTSLDGKSILPAPHEGFFAIQRLLEGKLVASAHMVWDEEADETGHGKDEEDSGIASQQKKSRSCFFIFADLSIRTCGTYRLHFSLLRLGRQMENLTMKNAVTASGPSSGGVVAQCTSEPFRIVHARDFAGISESTPLAKSFASQGVHIPIRNETKWRSRGRLTQDQVEHRSQQPDENGDT